MPRLDRAFTALKVRKRPTSVLRFILILIVIGLVCNSFGRNSKMQTDKILIMQDSDQAPNSLADTDQEITISGDKVETFHKIPPEDLQLFETTYDPADFVGNARRMRVLASTLKVKYDPAVVEKLENYLFPWIKPFVENISGLKYKFKGRGIVMCVADNFLHDALTTITIIRNYFKSKLPIEIMYLGKKELSVKSKKELLKFTNIKFKDLAVIFPQTELQGWAMKPFAILASSFDETIIIDADVVFLQHPEKLFQAPKYKETGAVFFHDRSLWTSSHSINWVKKLFDDKGLESVSHLRFIQFQTGHEQESGVVLIRKSDRYLGLLVTCWMNLKSERDIANKYVHGDKETFWIGFTIVHEPFTFVDADTTALLGEPESDRIVCSSQLGHLDWNGDIFWFNSGLRIDKEDNKSDQRTVAKLTHYGVPGSWYWIDYHTFCLESKDKLISLSVENLNAIKEGSKFWTSENK